jgi:nucleoredoxin
MPWLALPFESEKKGELASRYNVTGIPTLIVLDENGNTVSSEGRRDVMESGPKAFDLWRGGLK